MNMRRACMLGVLAVLMTVLSAGNLTAQRFGVRVGIAPGFRAPVVTPGFGLPLTVPFGVASSTFGFTGIPAPFIVNSGGFGGNLALGAGVFGCCGPRAFRIIAPGQAFAPGQIIVPGLALPGFVSGQVLVTGPRVFRLQPVSPQSRGVPRLGFVPGTIVTGVPLGFAGVPVTGAPGTELPALGTGLPPLGTGLPPFGTSVEQVVSQFGPPTVSIVTSAGETLNFAGGVRVFIQNGRVASPR